MKKILMYTLPEKTPVLKQYKDEKIIFREDLSSEAKEFIMKYYNRIGSTFDEKYETILNYEKKDNKLPIFIDNPRIVFVAKNDDLNLDL